MYFLKANMEGKRMIKRIEWIDIAKGIGIIFVMIGHCVYFGGGIHNFIFSWHMPMFFILSGFVFVIEDKKKIVKRKMKTLLLPYVLFSCIGLCITLIIPAWRNKYGLKAFIYDVYMASPDYANVSSIWFLVCLFITTILFVFLSQISNKYISYIGISVCALLGFCFSYSRFNIPYLPGKRLPWNIDVALVSVLFFAIGYYIKNYTFEIVSKYQQCKIVLKFIIILVVFTVSVIGVCLNGRVNLHGLTFQNPILYIINAMSGTALIILISIILSDMRKVKKLFLWYGRNSLKLLGIQAIVVRLYIVAVNTIFNANYELYFLPANHVFYASIMVIGISSLIVTAYNKIKKCINCKNNFELFT